MQGYERRTMFRGNLSEILGQVRRIAHAAVILATTSPSVSAEVSQMRH